MTTQYNIVSYGTLTNTNGVLSDFSVSNYATLPKKFAPSGDNFEIVIKFKLDSIDTSGNTYPTLLASSNTSTDWDGYNFQVYEGALYFELVQNDEAVVVVHDNTKVLSANVDYYAKVTFDGSAYTTYISTNGTTWTQQATVTSSAYYQPTNINITYLGRQNYEDITNTLNGSIDLNESYININDVRWWQGATTIPSSVETRIQLRHDTSTNWITVNPVLLEGEVGIETDTLKQKVGNGTTAWNSLAYSVNTINNTAFDGQWVNVDQEILSTTTSLNGSTDLSYRIDVPNDEYKYEVMIRGIGWTGSTAGNEIYIGIKGNKDTMIRYVGRARAAQSGTFVCAGTTICIVSYVGSGSTNFTLSRNTAWNGSCSELKVIAYRRLGTNT